MTHVFAAGAEKVTTFGPSSRRIAVAATAGLAFVGGLLATDPSETSHAIARFGPELGQLLRFMAAVKALIALANVGVLSWRMTLPTAFPRFTLYVIAAAAVAAGPGLIWGLVHVVLGAILLHAGLAACLVLLWRDPAVVARLGELVTLRRRDLGLR